MACAASALYLLDNHLHNHYSSRAGAVVDNDMLDLDWCHMECVGLDTLPASVVAAHIAHSPSELAEQAYHRDADRNDDLAEIPDASSLAQRGLDLDSLNVVVVLRAEDKPVRGLVNTWASADTAAEAGPCIARLAAGVQSLELPWVDFAHA